MGISGVPPLSGFFTKDLILVQAYMHSRELFLLAALTSGLTAFYIFRVCFIIFHGTPRNPEKFSGSSESPSVMLIPMACLGFLSFFSGMFLTNGAIFDKLLSLGNYGSRTAVAPSHAPHTQIAVFSVAIAAAGLYAAYRLYIRSPGLTSGMRNALAPLVRALDLGFGLDALYLRLVDASDAVSRVLSRFDHHIIDQSFVDGFGVLTRVFSRLGDLYDRFFIDEICVDGVGATTKRLGRLIAKAQSGFVQNYLLYVAVAAALFSILVVTTHY